MTLTCESYNEDIHSLDMSHVSSLFSGLNLLKISVQRSLIQSHYRREWALQRRAVGQLEHALAFGTSCPGLTEYKCKSRTLVSGECATVILTGKLSSVG